MWKSFSQLLPSNVYKVLTEETLSDGILGDWVSRTGFRGEGLDGEPSDPIRSAFTFFNWDLK